MPAGTVRLHGVLAAPPARVCRGFLEPQAPAKWLPPHGSVGRYHHAGCRVSGVATDRLATRRCLKPDSTELPQVEAVSGNFGVLSPRFRDSGRPGGVESCPWTRCCTLIPDPYPQNAA